MTKKKFNKKRNGTKVKDLSARILKELNKHSQQWFNHKQIAAKLDLSSEKEKQEIHDELKRLKKQKRVKETGKGQI